MWMAAGRERRDLQSRGRMTLLRGKGLGLEIVLSECDLDVALADLDARLGEQPNFYRGSRATAVFGQVVPSAEQLEALRRLLSARGIELNGLCGGAEIEQLALENELHFTVDTSAQSVTRERKVEAAHPAELSDAARSLVADFAGARADIAARRKRGEASVRRVDIGEAVTPLRLVEAVTTLYHTGTLRGGQALHHVGNLVVVGDVNPGAEVVATGDVVVFGRLSGVAHAGAQGDDGARIYAIRLDAVQLRIASRIAAESESVARPVRPEVAIVREGHIVIIPFEDLYREKLEAFH
jgi:septum site-determining protein MinC